MARMECVAYSAAQSREYQLKTTHKRRLAQSTSFWYCSSSSKESPMAAKVHATWCTLFLLSTAAAVSSACDQCQFPPKEPPADPYCPMNTLKLGVCADLLGGAVGVVVGTPPYSNCCSLIQGLADLEAAACICTAIKANVLGVINLDVPVALSLLVSACGKKIPDEFKCV